MFPLPTPPSIIRHTNGRSESARQRERGLEEEGKGCSEKTQEQQTGGTTLERSGVVCLSVCLFLFLKDIGETKASSATELCETHTDNFKFPHQKGHVQLILRTCNNIPKMVS